MNKIDAFVGHSFTDNDKEVVRKFLEFFNGVKDIVPGFTWDHAEAAEPKILSEKVKEKMKGKNLFIGICTVKEWVINPEKLKQGRFDKRFLKVQPADFKRKTSDWILQEIGYAMGKDMDIMLMVEEGLRSLSGLQGDMEYISFNRNEPEKAFTKLLEMLRCLMPRPVAAEVSPVEKVTERDVEKKESVQKEIGQRVPSDDWGHDEYFSALLDAIEMKDEKKEQEIFDKYLQTKEGQDEYEKPRWEAERLYLHHLFGKEEILEKLKNLQREYPNHSGIHFYLGSMYKDYEEYDKAADCFVKAAKHAKSDPERLQRLSDSLVSLAKHSNVGGVEAILEKMKGLTNEGTDGGVILLKAMAEISKIKGEDDNYLAFMEGMLDIKPDDHDTRFSLSYKYAEVGENDLAMYHYRLIANQRPNEAVWNNLGVARSNLGLIGKSIKAYRESEKQGGTLAMSNLAHQLIKAGFLDEAEEICSRATKIENYDARVGNAISKIKEVKEEEDKKEQKIVEHTKKKRSFYAEYAHACSKKLPSDFSGIWKGPDCSLNVLLKDRRFEATGSFQQKKNDLLAAIFASSQAGVPSKEPPTVTIKVHYIGDLIGRGVRYKLWNQEEGGSPSLMPPDSAKEGLVVISDDLAEIKVYEKGTRANEKFYALNRIG